MQTRRLLRPLSKDQRRDVLQQLFGASSPQFDFFLLVLLSTVIATFGLVTNSAAVIIGAMLVAPLMSPILGLSLAAIAGEQRMFKRAILASIEGAAFAVLLSAILGLFAQALPFDLLNELPSEVLARTHPTPFDLAIALAGGAAAAYAIAQPHISAALPGVAIATALLPPLCTIGIGVSLGESSVWVGALLLFTTNFVAIAFAGLTVFALLGFRPVHLSARHREFQVAGALVLLVTIPLFLLSTRFVAEARAVRATHTAVEEQVAKIKEAQLVGIEDLGSKEGARVLQITVRAPERPTYSEVVDIQDAIGQRLQQRIALVLLHVPTTVLDARKPPTPSPTPTPSPKPSSTPARSPGPAGTPALVSPPPG